MKYIKLILVIMAATMITLALGGNVLAFHEGGVAHCDGCHTMHNSEGGAAIIEHGPAASTPGTGGNASLTKGTDNSSTCLNCHQGYKGYHIASRDTDPGPNLNAGGDFFWLKNDYTVNTGHSVETYKGEEFGHNIVAEDYGYVEDSTLHNAPTSSGPTGFPAANLACSSCHDPHGKVDYSLGTTHQPIVGSGSYGGVGLDLTTGIMGNYRLLGTAGYQPDGARGSFSNPAPIAYSRNVSGGFYGERVDYGSGMSEWCANCHTGFAVASSNGVHKHPASNDAELSARNIYANYNAYIKTGDLQGTAANSYLGLVPFERGITDPTDAGLNPDTQAGATPTSNVMCLTCHRAHANGFRNAGRWDFGNELLVESRPTVGDDGYPYGSQQGYYYAGAVIDISTTFGPNQRSLCNKCHVQD